MLLARTNRANEIGIFFVNTSQTKEHFARSAFCFGTMCSACAERDVHFVRDVSFGSDVRFAREEYENQAYVLAFTGSSARNARRFF